MRIALASQAGRCRNGGCTGRVQLGISHPPVMQERCVRKDQRVLKSQDERCHERTWPSTLKALRVHDLKTTSIRERITKRISNRICLQFGRMKNHEMKHDFLLFLRDYWTSIQDLAMYDVRTVCAELSVRPSPPYIVIV